MIQSRLQKTDNEMFAVRSSSGDSESPQTVLNPFSCLYRAGLCISVCVCVCVCVFVCLKLGTDSSVCIYHI